MKKSKIFQRLFNFCCKIFPWNYIIFLKKKMFSGIGFTMLSLSQIWLFLTIGASSHSELTTKLQRTLWSQLCAIYEWCYIWIDILRKFSKDFLRTLQRVSGSTTTYILRVYSSFGYWKMGFDYQLYHLLAHWLRVTFLLPLNLNFLIWKRTIKCLTDSSAGKMKYYT